MESTEHPEDIRDFNLVLIKEESMILCRGSRVEVRCLPPLSVRELPEILRKSIEEGWRLAVVLKDPPDPEKVRVYLETPGVSVSTMPGATALFVLDVELVQ